MRGTVDKVWHNHRADGSEHWVLSIDGKRYGTWKKEMVSDVEPGDTVEFMYAPSGRYRNLTALYVVRKAGFRTADELAVSPESMRIVRMNCLRTAAELLDGANMLPERKVSQALAIAKRLEKHVTGGCRCDCKAGDEKEGTE